MCCLNSGQGTAVLCSWVSDRTFFFFFLCYSVRFCVIPALYQPVNALCGDTMESFMFPKLFLG